MNVNIISPPWYSTMNGFNEILQDELHSFVEEIPYVNCISTQNSFEKAELYIVVAQYREEVRSEWLKNLCITIKEKFANAIIGVCGKATTESHKYILHSYNVDFVIKGEPELVIKNIINNWLSTKPNCLADVNGITYKNGKKIIENGLQKCIGDYDSMPIPKFKYLLRTKNKYPIAVLLSSRGCHGNCKFCEGNICRKFNPGPTYRAKTAERVYEEIEYVSKVRNRRVLAFADDNYIVDNNYGLIRAEKIAKKIIDNKLNIRYTIECRADDIEYELFKDLKRSGLYKVFVGVESGSQSFLDRLGKGTTVEINKKAIETLKKLNIICEPGYIFFDSFTTISELKESIHFFDLYKESLYSPMFGGGTNKLYYLNNSILLKEYWPNESDEFRYNIANELTEYPFAHESTRILYNLYCNIINTISKAPNENMLNWRLQCLKEAFKRYDE